MNLISQIHIVAHRGEKDQNLLHGRQGTAQAIRSMAERLSYIHKLNVQCSIYPFRDLPFCSHYRPTMTTIDRLIEEQQWTAI
jgi:hypothetical protein